MEQCLGAFGSSTEHLPALKVSSIRGPDLLFAPRAAPPDLTLCPSVQTILDSSVSPYAQHWAASNLLKMSTEHILRWALCRAGQGAAAAAAQQICQTSHMLTHRAMI